ncbi:hypothetical protein [Spirillospora albida]|uniref:hypothetical protein n=1 Tax=Spirillospora albida TaxID=58123 RepID=UPI000ABA6691|nr:hypothetical protein [Spirillospora albida]
MPLATGLTAVVLCGLLAMLATVRRGRTRPPARPGRPAAPRAAAPGGAERHPESLTAVLDPADEEYLAWLADHHWPTDEYLDLVPERAAEPSAGPGRDPSGDLPSDLPFDVLLDADGTGGYVSPLCPRCRVRREDVWPCPACGGLLHSSCGHGMRRRRVARPYRTRGTNPETVVAEWICEGCTSVVGLDVTHADDPDGDLLP